MAAGAHVIDVRRYGAKGDGSTDDAAAIQAAINAGSAGSVILFPRPTSSYILRSPVNIPAARTITGDGQYTTVIIAIGCDAFTTTTGASNVIVKDIDIAQAVRHTTTPNNYTAITITGSTGARPSNWFMQNVLLDGFETGIQASWLWSSTFHNLRFKAGDYGIVVTDLSVNNFVTQSQLTGPGSTAGAGITLDGTTTATEGWTITDSLIYGFGVGVHGIACTHCKVANCLIDHIYTTGILIESAGVSMGGNWEISHNYIAMLGSAGVAGVKNANTVANASFLRGNTITGNRILAYAGAVCPHGIIATHANAGPDHATGNVIYGFATADIDISAGTTCMATDNRCLSPVTPNVIGGLIRHSGAGSPESVVAADVGSTWTRTDGGASTTLYVKESGSGNTGWRAV